MVSLIIELHVTYIGKVRPSLHITSLKSSLTFTIPGVSFSPGLSTVNLFVDSLLPILFFTLISKSFSIQYFRPTTAAMMDLKRAPEIINGQRKYHHSDGFQKSIPSLMFSFWEERFQQLLNLIFKVIPCWFATKTENFTMSRLNPLQPGTCRRTVSLETVLGHHEIQENKLRGKREAYKRRNDLYVKAMYGNPSEKEEVK